MWIFREPVVEPSAPSLPASSDDVHSFADPEPEGESLMEMMPPPDVSPASDAEPADGVVINIGEWMDPDDLSTLEPVTSLYSAADWEVILRRLEIYLASASHTEDIDDSPNGVLMSLFHLKSASPCRGVMAAGNQLVMLFC